MSAPGRIKAALRASPILLLAACQSAPPPTAIIQPSVAEAAPQAPARPAWRAPSQDLPHAVPTASVETATLPPSASSDTEALLQRHFAALGEAAFDDPGALKGRRAARVAAILGDPDLVRRDAPAEMWQYASEGCVLTLILYQKGDELMVEHVETRDRAKGQPVAGAGCFKALLTERLAAG